MTAVDVVVSLAMPAHRAVIVLNHNLHSADHHHRHEWFRQLYRRADAVIIDGWPILWLAKVGGARYLNRNFRVGSTDWIAKLSTHGDLAGKRLFLLGGTPRANEKARTELADANPGAVISGRDGYFDLDVSATDVVHDIRSFEPHIVLVGMGMPRQERFLFNVLDRLPPAYYLSVGGALDYVAGINRLSPRWVGAIGLEWLWRLAHEPRRLGKRYLVEPVRLIRSIVRERRRGSDQS